jgi:ATP-binding cassette subfamily B protein
MFTYYWKLALVILLVIPFYALIYFILNKFNKKSRANHYGKRSQLQTQLVESTPIRTVKEFGIEEFSNLKTENRFVKLLFTTYKSGFSIFCRYFNTVFSFDIYRYFNVGWFGLRY